MINQFSYNYRDDSTVSIRYRGKEVATAVKGIDRWMVKMAWGAERSYCNLSVASEVIERAVKSRLGS